MRETRRQLAERMIWGTLGERTVGPGDFPPQHLSPICRYFHRLWLKFYSPPRVSLSIPPAKESHWVWLPIVLPVPSTDRVNKEELVNECMNKGTSEERMCKEKSPVAQPAGAAVPWELLLFPQKQETVDWADLAPEIPMIAISLEAVSISPMLSLLSIVVVESLSRVQLFAIPWAATCQASLSSTMSWNLLRLVSIELMMPSIHLILCCWLLLHSIFGPFQWAKYQNSVLSLFL